MLEIIIALLVVGLDQYTKYLTDIHLMPLGTSVPFLENVVHFTSAHNTGAAFGMFQGGRWFFLVITVAMCAAMIVFLVKMRSRVHLLLRIILALLIGGALGNLIDRTLLGYVRDMIELRFIDFAIFNVADSAVSVSAVLLILDTFFGKSKAIFDDFPNIKTKEALADTSDIREIEPDYSETPEPQAEALQTEQTHGDG